VAGVFGGVEVEDGEGRRSAEDQGDCAGLACSLREGVGGDSKRFERIEMQEQFPEL